MAVEMEATAIAQTCYQFNVPFVVVRAVSGLSKWRSGNELRSIFRKSSCIIKSNC